MTKSMSQFEIILFKLENVTTRMTQYLMKSFLVQKVVVNLTHITRVHNYIYEHSNGVIEINKSYLLTITVCKNRIFPESCELIELKKKLSVTVYWYSRISTLIMCRSKKASSTNMLSRLERRFLCHLQ